MAIVNKTNSTSSWWGSTLWNHTRDTLVTGAKATGLMVSELLIGRSIIPIMTRNGLCMEHLLSKNSYKTIYKITNSLLIPRDFISNIFHLKDYQITNAIAPVLEEFQFRYLLQQVALRDIPQALLNKFFSNKNINIDALPIKTLRLLFVASLFALLHHQYAACENGGGISTFIGGLLYSSLIELGDSALYTACLHLMWNQFAPAMDLLLDRGIQSLQ